MTKHHLDLVHEFYIFKSFGFCLSKTYLLGINWNLHILTAYTVNFKLFKVHQEAFLVLYKDVYFRITCFRTMIFRMQSVDFEPLLNMKGTKVNNIFVLSASFISGFVKILFRFTTTKN